jgi:hypothetical protein
VRTMMKVRTTTRMRRTAATTEAAAVRGGP